MRKLLALTALLGVAACASYPDQSSSMPDALVGMERATTEGAKNQVVVVRILTGLDESAAPDLRLRYINEAYYGWPKFAGQKALDINSLDHSISKTTIYGMQLFEALRTALPEATVVPQPVTLTSDEAGRARLASTSVVPTPDVVIDFFAYTPPDWTPGGSQPFATVGRTVVPIFSVRAAPDLSPETDGAVSGMKYLSKLVIAGEGSGAFAGAGAGIPELLNCRCDDAYNKEHKKLSGLITPKADYTIEKQEQVDERPWTRGKYVAWPSYKLNFDTLETLDGRTDIGADPSFKAIIGLVRDVISASEAHPQSARAIRAERIAYYDDTAAARIRAGEQLDPTRAAALEVIEQTELKFFAAKSAEFVDTFMTEDMRSAFLAARKEEQSQIKTAKTWSWIGTALSVASAGAASYNGSALAMQNSTTLINAMSQSLKDGFANVAQSVDLAQGQFGQQQVALTMTLAEGERQLSVRNYDDLRAKLREFYQRSVGSGL